MKYTLIEPGDMVVSCREEAVLETLLGSCIGLALYDQDAQAGGVVHVLLPSGPTHKMEETPLYYAQSAIPALIDALLEKGATMSGIVAHMAGGAHIVTKGAIQDLNIGKRNTIKAKEILDAYAIPIISMDVGGSVGRRLKLTLPTGEVEIKRSRGAKGGLIGDKDEPRPKAPRLDENSLRKMASELKPDSNVAIRALQLVRGDDICFRELEELILKDQVLCGRILGIVNSARYGLQRQITKLSHAINLLGTTTFKKIVMQACIKGLYSKPFKGYELDDQAFFHHAVACAELSQFLADRLAIADPEEAYLAALMHDIGKILVEQNFTNTFITVKMSASIKRIPFFLAEKECLGTDHAELGKFVAQEWGLPNALVRAISYHHEPHKTDDSKELVGIVHVSNYICNMLGIGLGCDTMSNILDTDTLALLRMDEGTVTEIIEYVPRILFTHGQ